MENLSIIGLKQIISKVTAFMKKFFDVYFYLGSQWRYENDILIGALFWGYPISVWLGTIANSIRKIFNFELPTLVALILTIVLTWFIYLYYKHNGRGERIIDTFNRKKYMVKWYVRVLLMLLYIFIFTFSAKVFSCIIDYFIS